MLVIKRLTECTLDDVLKAWNTGFEGYFVNLTMTPETSLKRFPAEDLSPELSIVAFVDREPAGIIVNGFRTINGVKTAWNGGTAVAAKYRKQGLGSALMQEALSIYEKEGVQLAMLEAINANEKAISLYKSLGYKIVDDLEFLEMTGLKENRAIFTGEHYTPRKAYPLHAGLLPFYKGGNPWQTHWQSAKDGEALILADESGTDAGYAYYKKTFSNEGVHVGTTVYQCEADESREDAKEILQTLLSYVFGAFAEDIRRVVLNLPLGRSTLLHSTLKEAGFMPFASLVMMNKEI